MLRQVLPVLQERQAAEHFASIQQVAGIDDLGQVLQQFIDAEDVNFALFSYVASLGQQAGALHEEIMQAHTRIAALRWAWQPVWVCLIHIAALR